jgi:hypothetical protein
MIKKFRPLLKSVICATLCQVLIISQAIGADNINKRFHLFKELNANKSSEYAAGAVDPEAVMMKVSLWGKIGKPGVYYIPVSTNLATLLSYGGGPLEDAKMNGIVIKRKMNGKEVTLEADLIDSVTGAEAADLVLAADDIVMVPQANRTLGATLKNVADFSLTWAVFLIAGFAVYDRIALFSK